MRSNKEKKDRGWWMGKERPNFHEKSVIGFWGRNDSRCELSGKDD